MYSDSVNKAFVKASPESPHSNDKAFVKASLENYDSADHDRAKRKRNLISTRKRTLEEVDKDQKKDEEKVSLCSNASGGSGASGRFKASGWLACSRIP